MKAIITTTVALSLAAIFAVSVDAQGQAPAGPPVLAKALAPAKSMSSLLRVTSPTYSGEELDDKYTQNGDNISPPLHWSPGPSGTQSFVVFAEDAGVDRHDPIVHWIVYNIPPHKQELSQAIPAGASLDDGTMQGKNVRGTIGYVGPKPPAGQTHPYHFEVFALNTSLKLDPASADRNAVVAAMKNHVLAEGDLVTNYTGK
ncbi:MAG TPA: YbhB/YbcL family Raf kinase inhibitor-like protein [Micropepsaceae bacterium]|nr:YbhB/YbcL family Raf kinase inhibitor-like protein [Micropepsaceae bacterium]